MPNDSWRKEHRYPGYDYASSGAYFITTCLNSRDPLFGMVQPPGVMTPSGAGQMILETWLELTNKFPGIELDAAVVMPDHFHGILHLGTDPSLDSVASLGKMMQWFKSLTTNRYINGVKELGWQPFDRYFWQKNYYDRILRNVLELESRRKYIEGNPGRWWESRN